MHTPLTSHTFTTHTAASADSVDPLAPPAVIVAGTRISRELVRLFVAGAFFALETVLRVGELRLVRTEARKRLT